MTGSYLIEFRVEGLLHHGCFVLGLLLYVRLQVSDSKGRRRGDEGRRRGKETREGDKETRKETSLMSAQSGLTGSCLDPPVSDSNTEIFFSNIVEAPSSSLTETTQHLKQFDQIIINN